MAKNTISICVPTYNRFDHLRQTLKNLLEITKAQDLIEEILVIDNNENNKAEDIIRKFSKKSKKIRYIKNEKNIGPENNFKKCIIESKGKYVWLIADDDFLFQDSIEKISDMIAINYDCIFLNWSLYSNDMKNIIQDKILSLNTVHALDKNIVLENFSTKISFISSVIFKKKLFTQEHLLIYEKFKKFQLSFLMLIYSIIEDDNLKLAYQDCQIIKQRGDNDSFLRDSAKNFYNVFSEGIYQFHNEIKLLNYNNSSINKSLKKSFYFFIFKDLISRKIKNNNFLFAYNSSIKNFGHVPTLKYLMYLIFFCPVMVLVFIKKIKNYLK